jgi:hypothetical protein
VYHHRLCLTLKANVFCTQSNLVIFVLMIIIIIITSSKPTLPLLVSFKWYVISKDAINCMVAIRDEFS